MYPCRGEVLVATLFTLFTLGLAQAAEAQGALGSLLPDGDDVEKRPHLGLAFAGLGKRSGQEPDQTDDGQMSAFEPGEKRYYHKGLQYAGLGKRFNPGIRFAGLGKRDDDLNKRLNPMLGYAGLGKRYNGDLLAEELDADKSKRYSNSVLYAGLGKRNYGDKRLSPGAEERYGLTRAHYRRGGRINPAVAFAGIGKRSAES